MAAINRPRQLTDIIQGCRIPQPCTLQPCINFPFLMWRLQKAPACLHTAILSVTFLSVNVNILEHFLWDISYTNNITIKKRNNITVLRLKACTRYEPDQNTINLHNALQRNQLLLTMSNDSITCSSGVIVIVMTLLHVPL